MDARNDNKLETYAPFETVNPLIYNLVYNQQIIDLMFAQFLERHENFKVDQFTVPLREKVAENCGERLFTKNTGAC